MRIIHGSLNAPLTEVKHRGNVDGVRVAALMPNTFEGAGLPRDTSWVFVSKHVDWERVIGGQDGKRAILDPGHVGSGMARVRALAMYFPPFRDPSDDPRELDVARRTRWADFLDAYPNDGRQRRASLSRRAV